jgi:SAM-dependent methyltransferase
MKTPEKKREEARERTKEIADEFAAKGDVFGWFDALYSEAEGNTENIPWADMEPNRFLADFAAKKSLTGNGRKALVVGCGLGDDARFLYDLGFKVSAFDISPTAIDWARKLHKNTDIQFKVMDLFKPDPEWLGKFDLVVEVYTIQPLPLELRPKVIDAISNFVGQNGRLIVVTRGRENSEETGDLPWALSFEDLSQFDSNGLKQIYFEEVFDDSEEEAKRRFVVEYERRS